MSKEELKKWLQDYRMNLLSLMGQDDYTTVELDVITDVLDKLNQNKEDENISQTKTKKMSNSELAMRIVELFNADMRGVWDSMMYDQKKLVLDILNQNEDESNN